MRVPKRYLPNPQEQNPFQDFTQTDSSCLNQKHFVTSSEFSERSLSGVQVNEEN